MNVFGFPQDNIGQTLRTLARAGVTWFKGRNSPLPVEPPQCSKDLIISQVQPPRGSRRTAIAKGTVSNYFPWWAFPGHLVYYTGEWREPSLHCLMAHLTGFTPPGSPLSTEQSSTPAITSSDSSAPAALPAFPTGRTVETTGSDSWSVASSSTTVLPEGESSYRPSRGGDRAGSGSLPSSSPITRGPPPGLTNGGKGSKASSRPPRALPGPLDSRAAKRAERAGPIVLGASDQDLWQATSTPAAQSKHGTLALSPQPIQRAADAGAIVLGLPSDEVWQVAEASATYGPPTLTEAMDAEMGDTSTNISVAVDVQNVQNNNQLNMVDASSHQTLVQVGIDPAVAIHLQGEVAQARGEAAALSQAKLHIAGEANRALAAAASENAALRADGARASADAQAQRSHLIEEGTKAVQAASSQAAADRAALQTASAERDAIAHQGRMAVASASSETAAAREAARVAKEERDQAAGRAASRQGTAARPDAVGAGEDPRTS